MTDKHRRFLGPVVEMRKLHDSAEQRIVHSAEMLDRKSLASVGDTTGERLTALLTETKAHTPEELAANVARIGELLGRFALYVPARFTDDPAEQAKYWAVRSGIFPAVGGSRPAGTTCLSEDVAFHIEDLPRATAELQAQIARHGLPALQSVLDALVAEGLDTAEIRTGSDGVELHVHAGGDPGVEDGL